MELISNLKNKKSQSSSSKEDTAQINERKKVLGLKIERKLTMAGLNPLQMVEMDLRDCRISNPDGSIVFEAKNAEVPKNWSQLANDILVSKYFRRAGVPSTGAEVSVKQVVFRIARTIREHGEMSTYFGGKEDADNFEAELTHLLLNQFGAFNSPVWFNVGLFHRYGILGSGGGYFFNEEEGRIEETKDAYSHPQSSACFIQGVEDDLMSIFELGKNEARIFKYGSGTGTNFSKIRGSMEKLGGGGSSSGLMSFLEVLDRGAGATKSGGTTRRAAKMVSLDVDHPEIEEFIDWKMREEKKVAALVAAGYSNDFNGEAYHTVAGQNSNNSVRLSDEFMNAVLESKPWETKLRTTGEVHHTYSAKDLFHKIATAAWQCADPGIQFDTTINRFHTCPKSGKINGSNPCSEYMFVDDSACNLASVNLLKFLKADGAFDLEMYSHACRIFFIAQDILVGLSSYPTAKIAQNSFDFRPLGLGYANLGTLLMVKGIPYDSDAGRGWCGALTAIMQGEAFSASAELAREKGAFTAFAKNRTAMLKVMELQKKAAELITDCPDSLRRKAQESLNQAYEWGKKYGYRNAQATVLAPTGTIGLLMDCDTTGIEPDFSLVKFKKLAGGGYFKIVNQSVPRALAVLGYDAKEIERILQYISGHLTFEGAPWINRESLTKRGLSEVDIRKVEAALFGVFELKYAFNRTNLSEEVMQQLKLTNHENILSELGFSEQQIAEADEWICGHMTIEGCPELKAEHLAVFDCANRNGKKGKRFLSPLSHIKMMAAAQPFLSGAISKTVNLPTDSSVEDVKNVYLESWKLGLKAVAIYRDGSKLSQPLSSARAEKKSSEVGQMSGEELLSLMGAATKRAEELGLQVKPSLRKLPKKRQGFTIEAKVGGHKIYLRTGNYPDGTLGEIFIDMHKEGAAFRSLLNCLAIAVSKGLQYGVPLNEYVDTFTFTRFEPNGFVEHDNIKSATSVMDFVFRALGMEYLGMTDFIHVKPETAVKKEEKKSVVSSLPLVEGEAPDQHYAQLMGDAPPCSTCGHTTVRNGSCYRCLNCGNSMGCS